MIAATKGCSHAGVSLAGSSQNKRLAGKLCPLLDSYREMLHVPQEYQGVVFPYLVAITAEYRQAFLRDGTDGFELLHAP